MLIGRLFGRYCRLGVSVAAAVALAASVLVVAPAANAVEVTRPGFAALSASGCTNAAIGRQCITVNGSGLHVNYVINFHNTIALTKCDLHARFLYVKNGNQGYVTAHYSDCYGPGYKVRWNANQNFDDNSQMCVTSKDSRTNGLWTYPACETIYT